MGHKISLTLLTIILLISLAGCSRSATPADQSDTPNGEAQESQGETYTETNSADEYQMLPLVSGRVADLQLDASADGTTQQLNKGELMSITLDSNSSTGYGWFASSSNQDVLTQIGEPQVIEPQATSGTPIVGAGGTEILYFGATETGTITLTLEYKKGWETDITPEKTIIITVEVK
ncbi:MAG: hypothetical protein A2030_02095 [Chloroflexi bacterium RBG_19FT_COMBO_50_10]|nr:MAG: hypothetical protein A2Y53_03565 [Chloroflexi bacterium RBG_16_47_49]OGO66199.1 MAG: hypothetical protein A2030_02095 [Chloroflexi bacterium RBG_19FT_COMBO_50_10]